MTTSKWHIEKHVRNANDDEDDNIPDFSVPLKKRRIR